MTTACVIEVHGASKQNKASCATTLPRKVYFLKPFFSLSPVGGISNSRVSIGSVSCRCQGRLSLEGFESKQQLGLAKFVRKTQCLLLTSIAGHCITHLGGNQTNIIFRDFPHYDALFGMFFSCPLFYPSWFQATCLKIE